MTQKNQATCRYCKKKITGKPRHGLHVNCFTQCFSLKNSSQNFQNLTPKQITSLSGPDIKKRNSSFFHGMFKKYSAEIAGEQYILKVAQDEYPELPEVEFISNSIGEILGLNLPEFFFIKLENVQNTFVTKNFMAKRPGSNLVHMYHFIGEEEKYDCKTILRIIADKCGKLSAIKDFIQMCLFDSLIGNHDRHGRNIALIQTGPSSYTLAPIYDNPSYIGIESEFLLAADHNPKGSIMTSATSEPTMKDYIQEFNDIGYQEITDEFTEKIIIKWPVIIMTVGQSSLSKRRKNAFIKILEKRRKEIG